MDRKFNDETLLARWLSGELSEEELAALTQREDFAILQKIAQQSTELQPPVSDKEKAWQALAQQAKIEPTPSASVKVRSIRTWWKVAIAASVLLVLGYWGWMQWPSSQGSRVVVAAPASQEQITLPDGSQVWLNAASKLQFDETNFAQNRILELEGEAFFRVQKGAQFTVKTSNGAIRVLGTSFNVYTRKNQLTVGCFTGKVGVSFDEFATTDVLEAGDQL
ncbi:MAG: FecR family protein, partial [Bacteroidota bacterium]